ncbi:hypothetical protein ACFWPQ_13855 [Streptomyces sp. NPDC058464]|uniref:hypothetical protein n=1 Tax=Streptomyces sp. NPDC058464 TaxID=3346511 RepID=UPI0036481B66
MRPDEGAMALSQSDVMRLLESLHTADAVETIRVLCERILQELIKAEATRAASSNVRPVVRRWCRLVLSGAVCSASSWWSAQT